MTGDEAVSFDVQVEHPVPGVAVMLVRGELDFVTAPGLHTAVEEKLITAATRLIMDFNDVTFLGSAGLAALIEIHTSRPDLQIVCSAPRALRAIQISGLSDWLHIVDSVSAALGTDTTDEPLEPA